MPSAFLNGQVPAGETWRLEQFSRAYVKAVAAAAGVTNWTSDVDNIGIDVHFKRGTTDGVRKYPQLECQLKATTEDCVRDDHVAFELDIPTYNKLRYTGLAVPRILVVVVMPRNVESWIVHSEDMMSMYRCGYWISLLGEPALPNTRSTTIRLPRSNRFDAQGLDQIFERLSNDQDP